MFADFNDPPFFNEPKPPVDRMAAIKLERPSPPAGAILPRGAEEGAEIAGGPGGGGGGGGAPEGIGEPRGGGGGGGGAPPTTAGDLMLMEGIDGDCLIPLFGTGGGGDDPWTMGFGLFIMGGIGGGAEAFADLFLDGGGGGGGPLLPMPDMSV